MNFDKLFCHYTYREESEQGDSPIPAPPPDPPANKDELNGAGKRALDRTKAELKELKERERARIKRLQEAGIFNPEGELDEESLSIVSKYRQEQKERQEEEERNAKFYREKAEKSDIEIKHLRNMQKELHDKMVKASVFQDYSATFNSNFRPSATKTNFKSAQDVVFDLIGHRIEPQLDENGDYTGYRVKDAKGDGYAYTPENKEFTLLDLISEVANDDQYGHLFAAEDTRRGYGLEGGKTGNGKGRRLSWEDRMKKRFPQAAKRASL